MKWRVKTRQSVQYKLYIALFNISDRFFICLPVVFLLGLSEDQIGEDEGRSNDEERLPDPPENIGQT